MNAPRLTFVTITKADPTGLAATLASVARWRALDLVEHIVVDGDGSAEVAAKAAGCRWLRQNGTGIAAAFNEGLAAARGEWVWFLNGGDRVHPELDPAWLLGHLGKTQADLVAGGLHCDGDARCRPLPPLRVQWPPLACWLPHPATLVRRGLLTSLHGFDPAFRIAMDHELWLRLLPRDPCIDTLSVPFACFDLSGLSQRPEARPQLRRENAAVLRRHGAGLLRIWLGIGRRLAAALARAWLRR